MNKFWKRKSVPHVLPLEEPRRNYVPLHTVTHRPVGNIPGCTPAPRDGTFIAVSAEEAAAITMARAEVWSKEMLKYVAGEYGGDHGYEDMKSAIDRGLKPMFGAYGEKL